VALLLWYEVCCVVHVAAAFSANVCAFLVIMRFRLLLYICPQRGLSVCLSHLCTVLKPCDACRCYLRGPMTHCVRWRHYVIPNGNEIFGSQTPSQSMKLQAAAKSSVLCCHLANTNERFRRLTNYFGPCYYYYC